MIRLSAREAFILVTVLLDVAGMGLILPVLPRLVEILAHVPPEAAGGTLGLLNATYCAVLFLSSCGLGCLSDRFGRRPVILLALAGSVMGYLLTAAASTLWLLVLARVIGGLCGASVAPCNAYLADVTPPARRGPIFGLVGAAFGLGLVVGPALGGVLGTVDFRLPFLVAAALSAVNLLFGWLVLPESLGAEHRRALRLGAFNPFAALRPRRHSTTVRLLLAGCFLYVAGQTTILQILVLFTRAELSWTPADIGLFVASICCIGGIVQIGLAPLLMRRWGERSTLIIGLAVTIILYGLYSFVDRSWQLYAVTIAGALAFAVQPAAQAILSGEIAPSEQGEGQGTLAALGSLAAILGYFLGGAGFTEAAHLRMAGIMPQLPPGASFGVGAVFIIGALGCAIAALRGRADHGVPGHNHAGLSIPAAD